MNFFSNMVNNALSFFMEKKTKKFVEKKALKKGQKRAYERFIRKLEANAKMPDASVLTRQQKRAQQRANAKAFRHEVLAMSDNSASLDHDWRVYT